MFTSSNVPFIAAIFATLTEQQATDAEQNLAIVTVADNIAIVNDSLTIVGRGRLETRLASLENTTAVLDGRIRRLELSGKLN